MLGTTRPEIAAAEAQEDSRPPGVHALALQRVEDFFDRVAHASVHFFEHIVVSVREFLVR